VHFGLHGVVPPLPGRKKPRKIIVPRKDRTFSDRDIIRLILRYLERTEKIRVLEFFGLGLDLPMPEKPPDLLATKVNKARVEIEIEIRTLEVLTKITSTAALIPGPQQSVLIAINKSLGGLLTILKAIGTLLT
jgi:hypothetical protein